MSKTNDRPLEYYLGLIYSINISKEEGGFFAKIEDLPGCLTQGDSLEEVYANIDEARKLWIETAYEDDYHIPLPEAELDYSGKFIVRVPKSVHKRLSEQAKKEGISLNQYLVFLLSQESALKAICSDIKSAKKDINYLANCQKGSASYLDIARGFSKTPQWLPDETTVKKGGARVVAAEYRGEEEFVRSA